MQPQGLVGEGGVQFVERQGAELVAVTLGAYVGKLQIGLFVEQHRPAAGVFGRSREQAEQGQQADDQGCGNPKPTHDEIPS